MPEKHALPLPLRQQFYVCRPGREVFDHGPYLSRESAIEEAPTDLELKGGARFQVGILVPHRLEIFTDDILASFQDAARRTGQAAPRGWADTLEDVCTRDGGVARGELSLALNTVLAGWLTRHELHPAFGVVQEVTEHRVPYSHADAVVFAAGLPWPPALIQTVLNRLPDHVAPEDFLERCATLGTSPLVALDSLDTIMGSGTAAAS